MLLVFFVCVPSSAFRDYAGRDKEVNIAMMLSALAPLCITPNLAAIEVRKLARFPFDFSLFTRALRAIFSRYARVMGEFTRKWRNFKASHDETRFMTFTFNY
jgi:hypothetical protein